MLGCLGSGVSVSGGVVRCNLKIELITSITLKMGPYLFFPGKASNGSEIGILIETTCRSCNAWACLSSSMHAIWQALGLRHPALTHSRQEEEEEFIQNRTRAGARFLTRWDQHAVAKRLP